MHICITECRRVQSRSNAWPDCLQSTSPSWVILDHFYDAVGVSYRLPVMEETIPSSLTDSQSPCTALMACLPLRLWHRSWYFVCTRQTHVAVKPLHWSHSKRCMVNIWCPEPNSTRSDQWVQMLNHYCQPITSLSISDATPDLEPGNEQSCHKMIWLNHWHTIFVTVSYFKCWLILVCNSQRSHQVLLANL